MLTYSAKVRSGRSSGKAIHSSLLSPASATARVLTLALLTTTVRMPCTHRRFSAMLKAECLIQQHAACILRDRQ